MAGTDASANRFERIRVEVFDLAGNAAFDQHFEQGRGHENNVGRSRLVMMTAAC
jgi:hypothetical protein